MKKIQLTFLLLTFHTIIFSQPSVIDTIIKDEKNDVRIIKFINGLDFTKSSNVTLIKKYFALSSQDELLLKSERKDNLGYTHAKYDLYHNGIKVDQAEAIVHIKNEKVVIINGDLPIISNLDSKPYISPQEAIQVALDTVKATKYAWEDMGTDEFSNTFPVPELVISN